MICLFVSALMLLWGRRKFRDPTYMTESEMGKECGHRRHPELGMTSCTWGGFKGALQHDKKSRHLESQKITLPYRWVKKG